MACSTDSCTSEYICITSSILSPLAVQVDFLTSWYTLHPLWILSNGCGLHCPLLCNTLRFGWCIDWTYIWDPGMEWCINSGLIANGCWPVEPKDFSCFYNYSVYTEYYGAYLHPPGYKPRIYGRVQPGLCQTARYKEYVYIIYPDAAGNDRCLSKKPNKQTSTYYCSPLSPWQCPCRSKLKLWFKRKRWDADARQDFTQPRTCKTCKTCKTLITAGDKCGPVGLEPEDSVN